ncbi:hypothetical protein MUP46_00715 [Patescibacteria group bacterium]|nr:hypothetical protein [Patescibacteria group bacterium]
MQSERANSLHSQVEAFAEELRSNPDVVGVWIRLDLENHGNEIVVHEKADQSAEATIFGPSGERETFQGRIVPKRLNRGYAIRQEFFVASAGKREILLREGEF